MTDTPKGNLEPFEEAVKRQQKDEARQKAELDEFAAEISAPAPTKDDDTDH